MNFKKSHIVSRYRKNGLMQCHSGLPPLSLGQGRKFHWERRSATGPVAMIPHCFGEGEFECLLGLGEGLSGF